MADVFVSEVNGVHDDDLDRVKGRKDNITPLDIDQDNVRPTFRTGPKSISKKSKFNRKQNSSKNRFVKSSSNNRRTAFDYAANVMNKDQPTQVPNLPNLVSVEGERYDSSSYKLFNVVGNNIAVREYNKILNLYGSTNVTNFHYDLDFEVNVSFEDLDSQAEVFAKQLVSKHEDNLYKIFGNKREIYVTECIKAYIYSAAKAYFQGNMCPVYDDFYNSVSLIFVGHLIWQETIRRRKFFCPQAANIHIDMSIDCSNFNYKNERLKWITRYPFLEKAFNDYGAESFRILESSAERTLSGMRNVCGHDLFIFHCYEYQYVNKWLKCDSLTLGNSFRLKDEHTYCYSFDPMRGFNDLSYLFGRACFIYIKEDSFFRHMSAFEMVDLPLNDVYSKHDVFFITGLYSEYYPSKNSGNFGFNPVVPTFGFNSTNTTNIDFESSLVSPNSIVRSIQDGIRQIITDIVPSRFGNNMITVDNINNALELVSNINADFKLDGEIVIDLSGLTSVVDKSGKVIGKVVDLVAEGAEGVSKMVDAITVKRGRFQGDAFKISDNSISVGDSLNLVFGAGAITKLSLEDINALLRIASLTILYNRSLITESLLKHYLSADYRTRFNISIDIKETTINYYITYNFGGIIPPGWVGKFEKGSK